MDLTKLKPTKVVENHSTKYPTEFITKPKQKYLVLEEDEKKKQIFSNMTIEDYYSHFSKNGGSYYDLHGHEFQNWALRYTNSLKKEEIDKLAKSKKHADLRIVRARIYAISTRNEIDWNGQYIQNEDTKNKKQQEMDDYYESLTLYNWTIKDVVFKPKNDKLKTIFSVENIDTQESLKKMVKKYPKLNVAWLDLAAGHNVCGTYGNDFGGSQEEHVASRSNTTALLGTCGSIVKEGVKQYFRGNWVLYDDGYHIPPGGNYFCKTKFLVNDEMECSTIACAFADFRPYIPFFVPYSELGDFFTLLGGIKDQSNLEQRLMMDMHGVLKTAIQENIDVLVLGASGCGAFRHDPVLEAKLWNTVINSYQGFFVEISFAILDSENGKNIISFTNEFKDLFGK
eukprot:gene2547-3509_t